MKIGNGFVCDMNDHWTSLKLISFFDVRRSLQCEPDEEFYEIYARVHGSTNLEHEDYMDHTILLFKSESRAYEVLDHIMAGGAYD